VKTADFVQKDGYSCAACVLRYASYRLFGKNMSRESYVRLTGCRPDGVTMTKLRRVFEKTGFRAKGISLAASRISRSLQAGRLVAIDDFEKGHVVLVYGKNKSVLNIFDSKAKSGTRRRKIERVLKDAAEAFEVW